MGTIVKVQRKAGASYKAIIRQKGLLQPITKTFKSKSAARAWLKRVEADDELCRARGNRKAAGVTVCRTCFLYFNSTAAFDRHRVRATLGRKTSLFEPYGNG